MRVGIIQAEGWICPSRSPGGNDTERALAQFPAGSASDTKVRQTASGIDISSIIIYDNAMNQEAAISEQLRKRRTALGLSLSEVARRAGTSAAAISRYEKKWTRFEVYTLSKLATALDCDLEIALRPRQASQTPAVSRQRVVERLQRLFWDHELARSDLENHPLWVVERVLEYGTLEDVDLLRETLGRKAFLKSIAASSRLSPRTRNFWNQMLAMEGMKCTKKYSRDTAWNC
jgi:transcriptional regulator with XRE-family HTH domain